MPPVTHAFVLGAGLGKRLRPLTDRRPKPLVPLYHKPLITFAFDHLISNGIEHFAVNTHHCPEAYSTHLGERNGKAIYRGCPISFRHEPVLLDTGGGIKNAEDLVGNHPFAVYNGDVLADFPLEPLIAAHLATGHIATLALRSSGGPLHIQCDTTSGLVSDIRGTLGTRDDPSFLFTGISILSPEIFQHIPAGVILSIIPVYLEILKQLLQQIWLKMCQDGSKIDTFEDIMNDVAECGFYGGGIEVIKLAIKILEVSSENLLPCPHLLT